MSDENFVHEETMDEVREQEAILKHAVARDQIIDSRGRILERRVFHYLTCTKCRLRALLGLPKEGPDGQAL